MSQKPPHPDTVPGEPRRDFFKKALTVVIGGLATLTPLVPGLAFFLDPLLRKRNQPSARTPTADDEGFIRVTTTDLLPADGAPQKFTVIADQGDAWNYFPDQRIGSVFLRKIDGGGESPQVLAFSDVCPHLGCKVEYRPGAAQDEAFQCPCHASAFSLDGLKSHGPPPRDMDRLDVQVRNGNQVWVRYRKFRVGTEEQIDIS